MPENTTPSTSPATNEDTPRGNPANDKSKSNGNGKAANGNGTLLESHGTTVTGPDEITAPELKNVEVAQATDPQTTGSGSTGWTPGFRAQTAPERALKFERHFTQSEQDPFDTARWEKRTASITGENGKAVFEQKDCEIPAHWSQLATNVVVSKYFRGPMDTPQRETSVKQVIGRVADTIHSWSVSGGYFASPEDAQAFRDELVYLLLHQYGSFNSPVWFNLGVKGAKPQGSACFINDVYDDMESIMELAATEARLFKGGSGAGTNLFRIRSSREQLSGGGVASGPISFMRGWDAFAGAIKSGGTTRRAAKMVILNVDHPDIADFIICKANEEKKAWALIDAGYNGGFNVPGGAYDSVDFQNANHSVRVTDEFMRAAENNAPWSTRAVTTGKVVETLNARDMLRDIAEATHICGDPGMQYDTIINDWHTCINTDRIHASNPCCVTGDTLVAVADGRVAVPIQELVGTEVPVFAHDHATGKTTISRMWNIEVKRQNVPVFRVTLDDGSTFRATDDHLIMLRDGSYRMVRDLSAGDSLMPFHSKVLAPEKNRTKRRHIWTGASWTPQYRALWTAMNGEQPTGTHIHHADFDALNDSPDNLILMSAQEHNALHLSHMQGDANPARRLMNDQWRSNISSAVSGENNPMWGRTHSSASKATMSAKGKARFEDQRARDLAAARALQWMEEARAEGRKIGRTPKERTPRCCPVCRNNFGAVRETQVFCSNECHQSPMGRAMTGAKGGVAKQGRTPSAETRAKLSLSVSASSDPVVKSRAARAAHRNTALKTARLLLDNGFTPSLDNWGQMRSKARELGAKRVPQSGLINSLFSSTAELQDAATHYNHKVVSVEACGFEDVYDGTVDTHHNFAILTSEENSSAKGHANYSGIFIHNSEFMFLDSTACNLASINLLKFYDLETGHFDAKSYIHACDTFITAQEIIVSFASYPTAKIAENSERFRPLGLGFCNIGALLMAMGHAYDSDDGRAFAGALTAIMTGAAYRQSARIARNTGPFEGYARNREPMLRVIGKHRDAVGRIDHSLVAPNVMDEAHKCWDEALLIGQKHGYRNSQVTVLAPTGTISFMMDADTTGVEPDIALVKYKKLVGGGLLKIVNQTVPSALRKLGYDENEIATIIEYIDKNDTIEGAPGLRDEDLAVFDCAFKAMNGVRSIHHMGHIKMMAAAQPFLSGAISKTANMPQDCTVEDIMDAYMQAWKLGVKAVAIYRDGSKRTQPLSTSSDAQKAEKKEAEVKRALRRKLPDERMSITHKFSIAGQEGYFMVGLYEDGSPGEIFIKMSKEGSTISGLMDSFAVAISMCLQYGVPLRVLVNKFSHTRFEPSGYTTNREIPIAKSLMDYIFRWFDQKFHPNGDNGHFGKPAPAPEGSEPEAKKADRTPATKQASALATLPTLFSTATHEEGARNGNLADAQAQLMQIQSDSPPCPNCGAITVRSGACYKCNECGTTTGCG